MLQIQNLTKNFHSFRVINNISLELKAGEILGILGPEGAGKTTFFQVLTGLLPQDSGTIEPSNPQANRQWPKIGFKPEELYFPEGMTIRQYLSTIASMSGLPSGESSQAVSASLQLVQLTSASQHKIRQCSKGVRQRIGLAQALLGDPDILVLDEPSDGLDLEGWQEVQLIMSSLCERGRSILIGTSRLNEVQSACTDVAIMSKGEIVYRSTVAESRRSSATVRILCDGDLHDIRLLLESLHVDIRVIDDFVELGDRAIPLRRDVLRLLLSAGHDVLRIEKPKMSLADVYDQVVRS